MCSSHHIICVFYSAVAYNIPVFELTISQNFYDVLKAHDHENYIVDIVSNIVVPKMR